jgi:serine-aspartate repeat-containing protein C/D/E
LHDQTNTPMTTEHIFRHQPRTADRTGPGLPTALRHRAPPRARASAGRTLAAGLLLAAVALPAARAATLDVSPQIQLPRSELAGPGSFGYSAATRTLSLAGQPFVTQFQPGVNTFWGFSSATDKLNLSITLGACTPADAGAVSCDVVPSTGDNFVVQGNIPGQYSGTLLTGRVTAFGFADITTTDVFDFRVTVTGGQWVTDGLIPSGEVGLAAVIEGSTFVGSFGQDFRSTTGRVKGGFGPLPGITTPGGIASLGDRVFEDRNGDGIQNCTDTNNNGILGDAGDVGDECDAGIANVPVELFSANDGICGNGNDTSLAQTTTDANGFYGFGDLPAGDYCVQVTRPAGICSFGDAEFTSRNQGNDDERDSDVDADGRTGPITLVDGQMDPTWDAGVVCPARIGDTLFEDTNKDGSQTDGAGNPEPGVDGTLGNDDPADDLSVELYACDADGNRGALVGTTTIDANGNYFFDVLPGRYEVVFTAPDGTSFTLPNFPLAGDAADSDASLTGATGCIIEVASNEEDLTIDAGILLPEPDPLFSRFGNLLFHDKNRNGIQDGNEDGIDGTLYPATVEVYENCGAANEALIGTYDIDAAGEYLTDDLLAGDYCARFTPPAGFCVDDATGIDFGPAKFTLKDADDGLPGADTRDSDVDPDTGRIDAFFLPEDTTDLTRDAGVYCDALIGDRLWDDTDTVDGVQSADTDAEPGVADAEVTLYACVDGVPGTAIETTLTGADGFYEFFVAPGSYAVGFGIPADAGLRELHLHSSPTAARTTPSTATRTAPPASAPASRSRPRMRHQRRWRHLRAERVARRHLLP